MLCDRNIEMIGNKVMDIRQKNTLLVTAIIAGMMSLPMTWMTIHNAQFLFGVRNGLNQMFGEGLPGISVDVTGLNGHVTMLIKAPLWFVVCVAIGSSVLQLIQHSRVFAVPTFSAWGAAVFGLVWTMAPIVPAMLTGKVTPGIGWLLAMYCAAVPLVCLAVRSDPVNDAANNSDEEMTS